MKTIYHWQNSFVTLFTLMPDACFNDEDQREQILEVIRELKGNQVLPQYRILLLSEIL